LPTTIEAFGISLIILPEATPEGMAVTEHSLVWSEIVPPRSGLAFLVRKGQRFRIREVEGQQVSDLVVFLHSDPTERLSQGNTRKLNGTIRLTKGHRIYSTKCRPLLTIAEDTVGQHDILSSACSPYDYPIRFGVKDHPSCLAILRDVLAPHGIPEHLIPDPFNVFMHTQVSSDGSYTVYAPLSTAGDYVEFLAEEDLVVAMTTCPQDQNACNAYRIKPLEVQVLGSV
jgi:uncharacterized protein YcgI (DUF1989 family)